MNIPPEQSLIEYPCHFPIKVMGANVDGFLAAMVHVATAFDAGFDAATVEQTQLRSHERVPCALSVRVTRTPAGQSEPSAYRLQDLSGSGAALVGPRALGEPGQSLQLGLDFDLAATGTHEELLLGGDIQTVQPLKDASGQVKAYLHGIAFHKVEPRVLLLVYELQKPLAQGVRRA